MAQTSPTNPASITNREWQASHDRLYSRREVVIRQTEGEASYTLQAPYIVQDAGDTWQISGSQSPQPGMLTPIRVELRKTDAEVISYGMALIGVGKAPTPRSP